MHDVAVVGSGPAGLSAAIAARHAGLDVVLLEQGTLAETISKYPRRKLLLAEPVKVPLYGDLWVADASKEELLEIWSRAVERSGIRVLAHRRVEEIEPAGEVFFLRAGAETFAARRVVLAMGRRGTPRRLGVPGEEKAKVFYDIVEMEAFAGQRVLVVGGGDSAIESALGLANQPHTPVTLSYRGDTFARVKDRNRAKLEAAVAAGKVTALLGSTVREIRDDVVVLEHEGHAHVLPNDVVIVRIGGEAPYPFLERIGIRIVRKEIPFEPAVAG
jgi:thioredoxin reductase